MTANWSGSRLFLSTSPICINSKVLGCKIASFWILSGGFGISLIGKGILLNLSGKFLISLNSLLGGKSKMSGIVRASTSSWRLSLIFTKASRPKTLGGKSGLSKPILERFGGVLSIVFDNNSTWANYAYYWGMGIKWGKNVRPTHEIGSGREIKFLILFSSWLALLRGSWIDSISLSLSVGSWLIKYLNSTFFLAKKCLLPELV